MRFSLLFVVLGLPALLGACKPDPLEIDLPRQPSKLVVASGLGTFRDPLLGVEDSALAVVVSRSLNALSGASEGVQDSALLFQNLVLHARVVLRGRDRTDTLYQTGDGVYTLFEPQLQVNTPYTLEVFDSTTQQTTSASAFYLPQMRFDYVNPVVTRTPADTTVTLEYQLTDKPGPSFYMVQYVSLSAAARAATPSVENANSILDGLQNQQTLRLLTDNDFLNGRYQTRDRLAVHGTDTLMLSVAQISEDYFRFLEAYRKSGKVFNQLTGEPINYPTNVRDGYGFFNLHSIGARLIDLNLY